MIIYRMQFYPDLLQFQTSEYESYLWQYFSDLYRRGHILNKDDFLYFEENMYCYLCLCPEEGSLDKDVYNDTLKKIYAKIIHESVKEPSFVNLGKSIESQEYCSCTIPTKYILRTNALSLDSPISCGDCGKPVPLYIFSDYDDLIDKCIKWQQDYKNCENLFINGQISNNHFLNQLLNHNSELSQLGQDLCKELEIVIKKPVYYYLYNFSLYSKEFADCPKCEKNWKLSKRLYLDKYKYRCDTCKLIST